MGSLWVLALVSPPTRVLALLQLESASAVPLPIWFNPAGILLPLVLSAASATSGAATVPFARVLALLLLDLVLSAVSATSATFAAATIASTSSAAFLYAFFFCAVATAVSSSGSSVGSAGEKVTTTSIVPCVDSAIVNAVGVPGEHCARRISPVPSESFIPILSWSHTSNKSGAATSNTLSSSVSSQSGLTVPFLTEVFSFLPPADCTTTYGSDVPPLSPAMRLVARSTRTVTVPMGSLWVLALVSPPALLPILLRVRSSLPRLISTRSACKSARIAAISPSREPTCRCSAVCSSCSVSLTRCSSDTIVVAVSSAPSLPRKPSPR